MIANINNIKSADETISQKLVFSDDGKYLIGLDKEDYYRSSLKVWEISTGTLLFKAIPDYKPAKAGISSDGNYIAFLKSEINGKSEYPIYLSSPVMGLHEHERLADEFRIGPEDTVIYQFDREPYPLLSGLKKATIPSPTRIIQTPTGEHIRLQSLNHFEMTKGEAKDRNNRYSLIKDWTGTGMKIMDNARNTLLHEVNFTLEWFVDHPRLPIWAGYNKQKGLAILSLTEDNT